MTNWVYIKKESYLYTIFGDRPVKVKSLVPAIPREEGAPPCYWALSSDLSDPEILQLSILLYQRWRPECESIAQAEAYIKENNVPLAVSNTSGCETDEWGSGSFCSSPCAHSLILCLSVLETIAFTPSLI